MKNYVQPGDCLTLSAPSNIASGEAILVGSIFGIAAETVQSGAPLDLETRGVFVLPKDSTVLNLGSKAYWDNTAKRVSATASGNTLIGVAIEPSATVALSATVRLNGSFQ
jgi:predicted RecA/RadA family phage recombinase